MTLALYATGLIQGALIAGIIYLWNQGRKIDSGIRQANEDLDRLDRRTTTRHHPQ